MITADFHAKSSTWFWIWTDFFLFFFLSFVLFSVDFDRSFCCAMCESNIRVRMNMLTCVYYWQLLFKFNFIILRIHANKHHIASETSTYFQNEIETNWQIYWMRWRVRNRSERLRITFNANELVVWSKHWCQYPIWRNEFVSNTWRMNIHCEWRARVHYRYINCTLFWSFYVPINFC